MAHFAEINKSNNIVLRVVVVNNNDVYANGGEYSSKSEEWVSKNIAQDPYIKEQFNGVYPETYWKQTSYNSNARVHFAGIGMTYDSVKDAFIPIKAFNNWIFDEQILDWVPPIPVCSDTSEGAVMWDDVNIRWINGSNTKYWNGSNWIII